MVNYVEIVVAGLLTQGYIDQGGLRRLEAST